MRWLIAIPLLVACGTQAPTPLEDSYDPDAKADGSTAPLPFYTTVGARPLTVQGKSATAYRISKSLQAQGLDVLEEHAYGGCISGGAVRMSPSDLQDILASQESLERLAYAAIWAQEITDETGDEFTSEAVARRDRFSSVLARDIDAPLTEWSQEDRDAFKPALRITVRSMLSSSSAKVWHVSWSPDWTDEMWISADPGTGIVKALLHGGDC